MKFYNRNDELNTLNSLYNQVDDSAKMTFITGRRRVGKTYLSLQFAHSHKYLYFFVSKKSEYLLCQDFIAEIKKIFDVPIIGDIRYFKDIFKLLMELSKKEKFILIIDEFQEFYNINKSVYSDIQNLWDLNKNQSKMFLLCIGSVYSLMCKIFENSKEPLFGRADRNLYIKPFNVPTIYEVLKDNKVFSIQSLFDIYVFTGGNPRYIEILCSNNALEFNKMLSFITKKYSPFINEGKSILIEEFGKEYATYFSILKLISDGKTSRSKIESILEINTGGYLERLEKDYSIIRRYRPINSKRNSHLQKFYISDNFINFWFRFFYNNISSIETGNFKYIQDVIKRDYNTYSGIFLENLFKELLSDTGKYNRIGSYWEKGNQNQIDIVAVNDMEKYVLLAEVKLNKSRINLDILKKKSVKLIKDYPGYKIEFLKLSLEDCKKFPGIS